MCVHIVYTCIHCITLLQLITNICSKPFSLTTVLHVQGKKRQATGLENEVGKDRTVSLWDHRVLTVYCLDGMEST